MNNHISRHWRAYTLSILLVVLAIVIIPYISAGVSVRNVVQRTFSPVIPTNDMVVVKVTGIIAQEWAIDLDQALSRENTKGVILWIESPGGSTTEAKLLSHYINALRYKYHKPIHIFSEYLLASGAYWVATYADSIFAAPTASVGSIGVYAVRGDRTAADSIAGIKLFFFSMGEYKLWGAPNLPPSERELQSIADGVFWAYIEFVTTVTYNRYDQFKAITDKACGCNADTTTVVTYVRSLAEGNLYGAPNAFTAGLIDGVLYFDQLCTKLREQGFTVRRPDGTVIDLLY